MPQITPIAANSSQPRLLTLNSFDRRSFRVWERGGIYHPRQMPSGPMSRQMPLVGLAVGAGAAGDGDDVAAWLDVEAAGAVVPAAGVGSEPPPSVVPPPLFPAPVAVPVPEMTGEVTPGDPD